MIFGKGAKTQIFLLNLHTKHTRLKCCQFYTQHRKKIKKFPYLFGEVRGESLDGFQITVLLLPDDFVLNAVGNHTLGDRVQQTAVGLDGFDLGAGGGSGGDGARLGRHGQHLHLLAVGQGDLVGRARVGGRQQRRLVQLLQQRVALPELQRELLFQFLLENDQREGAPRGRSGRGTGTKVDAVSDEVVGYGTKKRMGVQQI